MSITADYHLHSAHSGDSDAPMEKMIQSGIRLGLSVMCFTEHMDIGYPDAPEAPGSIFLLDTEAYFREISRLRQIYQDKICLLSGVELGLQTDYAEAIHTYAASYPFDFIIGSSHICHGQDPYYPAFYEGRRQEDAYLEYFESILENIRHFQNYDVYGHLDYVVRYGPDKDRYYSYETYRDIFDEILRLLIEKGKGIELNTGGLKKGMRDVHPCTPILQRYRELGGEILTIGSDAHSPEHVADSFSRAAAVLEACGFRYYTVYENRVPRFCRL